MEIKTHTIVLEKVKLTHYSEITMMYMKMSVIKVHEIMKCKFTIQIFVLF